MFARLERAAAHELTVLLLGETGTGKEAAAFAIHDHGPRKGGPFVVVDCASIPSELLESELFGHVKGAFTGAIADRAGAFQEADGGTIFLDEIGELSPSLQPKLLRALEEREVKRVGGRGYNPVNVRVVAATHRDLARAVAAGNFRADLFYRLAVLEVRIPALRDRPDDLPELVESLLAEIGVGSGEREPLRDPQFLAGLARHRWPGNVRELRNYVERVVAFGQDADPPQAVGREPGPDLDGLIDVGVPLRAARERWAALLEPRYLERLLQAHGGNVSAAARAAGLDRSHFHRLVARRRPRGG